MSADIKEGLGSEGNFSLVIPQVNLESVDSQDLVRWGASLLSKKVGMGCVLFTQGNLSKTLSPISTKNTKKLAGHSGACL